jgi:hypothetical protein
VKAGRGADRIQTAGQGFDLVDCGPGRDHARIGNRDRQSGCERVVRGPL